MDPTLLLTFCVPLFVALIGIYYFNKTISYTEGFILFFGTCLIVSGFWYIGQIQGATDYEIWNGEITGKEIVKKNCKTGWRDSKDSFCINYTTREVRSGESCETVKNKKVCTPRYYTQYRYDYPWEQKFFINTNVKKSFEVERVDRQGEVIPPKFNSYNVGDPASSLQSYNNWLIAGSDNIFAEDGLVEDKYKDIIPEYPNKIYEMVKINRVVTIGEINYPNTLNNDISVMLRKIGPAKQMNFVLVLVDSNIAGDDIGYAIRKKWQGFKKNDAVAVIGLKDNIVSYASVFSWSKKSIFDIELKDAILENKDKEIDYNNLIKNVEFISNQSFERRSMAEFEYLKNDIPTPLWLTITCLIVSLVVSLGLLKVFNEVDISFRK